MSLKRTFRAGALLVAVFGLAGCESMGSIGSVFEGEPGPYDGRWVGRLTLSIGERKCVRRINISADVRASRMSGSVEHGRSRILYNGRINEDGEMPLGEIIQRDYGNEGTMVGTFGDKEASGTWENKRCKGRWTLRRVGTN